MRKQQLTMMASLLVFGVAAVAAAQTPSQLDRVNVVRGTDDIRIEISSHGAVTPKLSTLDTPARVVVDLPGTVMATGQSRIAVGAAGVKGVRIGMDGQTPPNTRIVVDLEQACAYELTPGAAGKLVLSLHRNAVAQAAVPASEPMSPFSPRVVDVASAAPKAEIVPPAKPVAKDSPSPNDYVYVEPTVRAQEAAARFADKTASELLPDSGNAAPAQSAGSGTQPAVNLAAEQKAQLEQKPATSGAKSPAPSIVVRPGCWSTWRRSAGPRPTRSTTTGPTPIRCKRWRCS